MAIKQSFTQTSRSEWERTYQDGVVYDRDVMLVGCLQRIAISLEGITSSLAEIQDLLDPDEREARRRNRKEAESNRLVYDKHNAAEKFAVEWLRSNIPAEKRVGNSDLIKESAWRLLEKASCWSRFKNGESIDQITKDLLGILEATALLDLGGFRKGSDRERRWKEMCSAPTKTESA